MQGISHCSNGSADNGHMRGVTASFADVDTVKTCAFAAVDIAARLSLATYRSHHRLT